MEVKMKRNEFTEDLSKVLFDELFDLARKFNRLSKPFGLATCDGCGKYDFKETMKTISAPFGGDTIYICLDCWNEFLKES
jgi:hypothetical protein